MIITIDGPAGSGKSSVARSLAKKLGFFHLGTGLLYRTLAYVLIMKRGTIVCQRFLRDSSLIISQDLDVLSDVKYTYDDQGIHIFYKDLEITHRITDVKIENFVSHLSSFQFVRDRLLDFQRSFAKNNDVVADGRDCGTIVFPHADVKFFLTADFQTRLNRICADTQRKSAYLEREQIAKELQERDHRDLTREIAPLKIADGAIVIDNSNLSQEETLECFLAEIEKIRK